MKITALDLTAFRSFQNLSISTDAPRVIIGGGNGTGKSSLRDAIRWTLTGKCSVTDGRGVGSELLQPVGADHVAAAVNIEHLGWVSRTRLTDGGQQTFSVEGLKGDASAQQQALFYKLQTQPEYLDAVLETEHFLRLDHADAKRLLLSLLDVKVTVGSVEYTLDELEAAYKGAYEDRKLAKAVLKTCHVPEKPVGDFPPVDQIEDLLGKLRGELTQAAGTAGEIAGKRKAIETRIAAVKGLIKPVPDDEGTDAVARLTEQVRALEAETDIAEAMPTVAPAKAPKKGDPQRVIWLRQTIEQIQDHQPTKGCVLARQVPCLTHRNKFLSEQKALQAELDTLQEPEPAVEAPRQNPRLEELKAAREALKVAEAIESRVQAIVAHNATQTAQIASLEAELADLPEGTVGDSGVVATLQARIGKGELMLKHAREYWTRKVDYDKAVKTNETQAQEVDRLEALVEELGPKGARVQALADAVERFQAAVNAVTGLWGWTVTFSVDPWAVIVNGRKLQTYSESEQFRIGIAIQLAVAVVSGVGFAIIDRIDMLDAANRAKVGQMLTDAPVEQIFMLATREPNVELPPNDGERIAYRFLLEDGRTVAQPAKAAA